MPLTTSSRFMSVTILMLSFTHQPEFVYCRIADGTEFFVNLLDGDGSLSSTDSQIVNTLRTIYASDDGFRNTDDVAVDLRVSGDFLPYSTIEELVEHGITWNPFVEGSYDAFIGKQKIEGMFITDSDFDRDSDTGKAKIEARFDIVPVARNPDGDTFAQPLSEWFVVTSPDDDKLILRLQVDRNDRYIASNILEHPSVGAMVSWLNTVRTSGSEVAHYNISGLTGRVFSIDQSDSDDDTFVCEVDSDSIHTYLYGPIIYRVQITLDATSSNTAELGRADIDTILDTTTGEIDIEDDDVIEEPDFGNTDVAVRAHHIILDDKRRLAHMGDSLEYWGVDIASGEKYRVPIGGFAGRVINFDNLEENSSSQKLVPLTSFTDSVHFRGTSDGVVRFPEPDELVLSPGTHRLYSFHNGSSSSSLEIKDWDDENIITLRSGEYARFQVVLNHNGEGELIGENLPRRYFINSSDNIVLETLGGVSYFEFSTNQRFYLIAYPDATTTNRYLDADAFVEGSGEISGGTTWEDNTNWNFDGSIEILKSGWVTLDLEFEIEVSDNAAGSIASYHSVRVYTQRGTSDPVMRTNIQYPAISGAGSIENFTAQYRGFHEPGDFIIPIWRLFSTTTMGENSVQFQNFRRTVTLDQSYRKVA